MTATGAAKLSIVSSERGGAGFNTSDDRNVVRGQSPTVALDDSWAV
jgi:hypothetical protein